MSGIFAYCQNFFQCCHARLDRASPFLLPKLLFCVIFEFANDSQIEFTRKFNVKHNFGIHFAQRKRQKWNTKHKRDR